MNRQRMQFVTCPIVLAGFLFFALVPAGMAASIQDPVIGPRDVLKISVFNEPAMSMEVVVSASGEFSFPLLQRVQAGGKTLDELGLHMEKRLREGRFLIDPSVTVTFVEQRYFTVTLTGAIGKPGIVPIYPGFRLRDLIAQQGGIHDKIAGPFIHIQQDTGNLIKICRDDLENGTQEQMREANIELSPGDDVIVPNANEFYVMGAVNQPGGFPLTRDITLGEALGMAGGRTEKGGNTLLWHCNKPESEPILITFTYHQYQEEPAIRNAPVHPGDSLYITQNDFIFVGGKVENPGTYPWQPKMNILSALLTAGGREFTASQSIELIREGGDGKQFMMKFRYSELRKDKEKNMGVLPGDILHVGANPLLNIPYTLRRINPFSFSLQMFEAAMF